jgi:hypothetical protein
MIFSQQKYLRNKKNKNFIVNRTKEPVVTILAQPLIMWSHNLVVLLEVDQLVETFFGVNNAQSQHPETFVVEKRSVEKDGLEKLMTKNKDKLTLLNFHGHV